MSSLALTLLYFVDITRNCITRIPMMGNTAVTRITRKCCTRRIKVASSTKYNIIIPSSTMATAAGLDAKVENENQEIKTNQAASSKFTVAIEGNIGSGKTTLIQYFSKSNNVEIYAEPVAKWRNLHGHNLLGLLYQDPTRWGLTFQSFVQLTMLDLHTRKQILPVKMLERSIYSAKYCFVENFYLSGKMPEAEYVVYTEWFKWILKNIPFSVDLIVYLRTDPEVVHKRILARNRPEEKTIPLNYLQQLHTLHEEWLVHQNPFKVPSPVLILDGNKDLKSMYELFEKKSHEILGGKNQQIVAL